MSNLRSDPFLHKTFFFGLVNTASASLPYLSSLWIIYLRWEMKGWHDLWTRSCYSLPAYHVGFFVRKITRVYKSFWWIEPFIFRRKCMEQSGPWGHLLLSCEHLPRPRLSLPAEVVLGSTWPQWGTAGFSISENNCSSPGERQKG